MAQSTILLALPGAQKQRCATLEPRFDTIIKCLYHEKDQERPETHDHIGQRKCLAFIMDEKVHRDKVNSKKKREEFEQLDVPEALNQINRRLEKIEKRENPRDTIVSFFRTQEKEILKPMSAKITNLHSKLQDILDALKSIQ